MADYRPNRRGMRELLKDPMLYRGLDPVADTVEARAKSNAPVEDAESAAERNRAPGRFRDSIHTEHHKGPSRVTVRVVADSEGAVPIERRTNTLGAGRRMIENGRWPSVPTAVVNALYDRFQVDVSTQLPADFDLPAVQVTRLGGTDDRVTDFARVQIIVIAGTEEAAETLAEDIRHFLVDTRPIRGAGLLLDGATTEVAPHRVPYADPQISEYLAVYVVTSRRG